MQKRSMRKFSKQGLSRAPRGGMDYFKKVTDKRKDVDGSIAKLRELFDDKRGEKIADILSPSNAQIFLPKIMAIEKDIKNIYSKMKKLSENDRNLVVDEALSMTRANAIKFIKAIDEKILQVYKELLVCSL